MYDRLNCDLVIIILKYSGVIITIHTRNLHDILGACDSDIIYYIPNNF